METLPWGSHADAAPPSLWNMYGPPASRMTSAPFFPSCTITSSPSTPALLPQLSLGFGPPQSGSL